MKKNIKLDVTIYIPVYNCASLVTRALNSVKAQELDSFECIVVNDGSTDDTLKVIKNYKFDKVGNDVCPWLRIISLEKNSGISIARNLAIQAARGQYVSGLDADDTLVKGGIQKLLNTAKENDFPDMVVGSANLFSELEGVSLLEASSMVLEEQSIAYELLNWKISPILWGTHWGKIVLKETFDMEGIGYLSGMAKYEDTEFFTRFLVKMKKFCSISDPVYNYYLYDGAATAKFKLQPQIDAAKILIKTHKNVVEKSFTGEKKDALLRRLNREDSFMFVSMIYVLYRTKDVDRYFWLKKIVKAANETIPNWKSNLKGGNPRVLRWSMNLGLWCTHLMMSIVSAVPFLRKRLRG